jgi:hypothetical protein
VTVRVKDAAGAPVPGAAVEAIPAPRTFFHTDARTGPDGAVTLRIPADAQIGSVIGLKPGAGFDYFENRQASPQDRAPLPAEITLTLDGAATVRVKAVDTAGRPVPGAVFGPAQVFKPGKIRGSSGVVTRATTDEHGVAVFDWLPKMGWTSSISLLPGGGYSPANQGVQLSASRPFEPMQILTARLLRKTQLSGTVRLPDGRPAPRVFIHVWSPYGAMNTRTAEDGTYAIGVPPEWLYVVAVVDETWAAPSRTGVVVREGQPQAGLDFALIKGTLLRGRVTEGPDHKPVAGAIVQLIQEGALFPQDLSNRWYNRAESARPATSDAAGRYYFTVGPGRYRLEGPPVAGTEPLTVEVKTEEELVRDIALRGPAKPQYLSGVVVEKGSPADRPVAGGAVTALPVGVNSNIARAVIDAQGRFRVHRRPVEMILYAVSKDRKLAGFTKVPSAGDEVTALVAEAGSITGRVVDMSGKPQAGRRVKVRLDSGPGFATSGHLTVWITTDQQGQFTFAGAAVGTEGEVSVLHQEDKLTGASTVAPFQVLGKDPVRVPDLVVPALAAAK